jgi:hypothetical protein
MHLAPGVFTTVRHWEIFSNRAHWMLINIDQAKGAVNKKEVNE